MPLPCSLNLGGRGFVSSAPGAASLLASEWAWQACVELGCPPTDVNAGEGALSALLAKSSVYTADRPDLQSYAKEDTS